MTRPPRITLAVFTLAGIHLGGGCSPSIDAAAKADVDRRVAALGTAGRDTFAAPNAPQPMPLAAGQWVTYRIVDTKKQPSFLTLKLVSRQGEAFWYEMVNDSYYGRNLTSSLVDFGDRRAPGSITVKAFRSKDSSGQVTEYPEAMMSLMNATLRGQLGPITYQWSGGPQEDAAVIAGQFAACYKGRSEGSALGQRTSALVWVHPAVPLGGIVRMMSDDGTAMELVALGTSGARSDF